MIKTKQVTFAGIILVAGWGAAWGSSENLYKAGEQRMRPMGVIATYRAGCSPYPQGGGCVSWYEGTAIEVMLEVKEDSSVAATYRTIFMGDGPQGARWSFMRMSPPDTSLYPPGTFGTGSRFEDTYDKAWGQRADLLGARVSATLTGGGAARAPGDHTVLVTVEIQDNNPGHFQVIKANGVR